MIKTSIKRAATIGALALGLGVTGATLPAIVAEPGSVAGPEVSQAAYGWGGICRTYRSPIDSSGRYYVVTYRWWTDSTGTYCSRYSTNWYYTKTWY